MVKTLQLIEATLVSTKNRIHKARRREPKVRSFVNERMMTLLRSADFRLQTNKYFVIEFHSKF